MIKKIIKKLLYKEKSSPENYVMYLKKIGCKIGKDCIIYSPRKTLIDVQYPWMIKIGDYVRIAEGVKILTHDYSWSVIKNVNGGIIGASGIVSIGNNVFIGMNAIILRNVIIGDNVVIGTGSVVTRNCESNSVYAGNPAKKIMTLDEFIEKRIAKQKEEAKCLATEYFSRYNKIPTEEVFHEYFMLFTDLETAKKNECFKNKMKLGNGDELCFKFLSNYKRPFKSFGEFIDWCLEK